MIQNYASRRSRFGLAWFVVTFFGLLVGFTASADNKCREVDLRRPELNQPQVQVFTNADGKISDSGMCASFSSALVTSQQLGVSINPVDYAFQSVINILSRSDKNYDFRQQGFCAQAAVNALLGKKQNNFVQAFNDFVFQVNPNGDAASFNQLDAVDLQKMSQWLGDICGKRIQDPSLQDIDIRLKPEDPSVRMQPGEHWMSKSEMGDEIDRMLDKGHFLQYTHAYHAVTIVGRTADCRYIIQDSIPESAWNELGAVLEPGDVYKDAASAKKDLAQIKFESQVFQYWPRDILIKNAVGISYVERGGI